MSFGIDDTNRARMAQWAKAETSSSRSAPVVGRNTGGSAAVTGHGLKHKGDGSFKAPRAVASSSESLGAVKPAKIHRDASFLSTAVSNKRDKFAKRT